MFKNNKWHKIFLLLGVLTLIIGSARMEHLKSTIDIREYNDMGTAIILIGVLLIFAWAFIAAVKAENRHDSKIEKGEAPVYESDCTHISGLASFTAEGKIRIYVDRIHFTVAGTHYDLPIERVRSADILTQKQTEYVSTSNMGRIILSGLLFGELGMLISAERAVDDRERTITEENLVITYEKDGEAKFIVLKNLPCDKVIREIKKLVPLAPRQVEL